jgi:hypothetical protein
MRGKSLNPNPLPTPLAMIPTPATVEGGSLPARAILRRRTGRVSDRRHAMRAKSQFEIGARGDPPANTPTVEDSRC